MLDTSRFFADPVASAEPATSREQGGIDLEKTDLIVDALSVSRERSDNRTFVTRRIADETIIVPVVGGVGDLDAIFTLNEVGSVIWQLVDTPTTVHAIVEEIALYVRRPVRSGRARRRRVPRQVGGGRPHSSAERADRPLRIGSFADGHGRAAWTSSATTSH